MLGLMQNRPLLISNIVDYVATWHAETEIVSRDPEGVMHRSSYGQVAARAKRVANALTALGVRQGDRVPWMMEGGKGSKPRAVHIQIRPDPLAK